MADTSKPANEADTEQISIRASKHLINVTLIAPFAIKLFGSASPETVPAPMESGQYSFQAGANEDGWDELW